MILQVRKSFPFVWAKQKGANSSSGILVKSAAQARPTLTVVLIVGIQGKFDNKVSLPFH